MLYDSYNLIKGEEEKRNATLPIQDYNELTSTEEFLSCKIPWSQQLSSLKLFQFVDIRQAFENAIFWAEEMRLEGWKATCTGTDDTWSLFCSPRLLVRSFLQFIVFLESSFLKYRLRTSYILGTLINARIKKWLSSQDPYHSQVTVVRI